MTEQERFVPKVITFKRARAAFVRLDKAEARKGKDGKPKGDPKFSMTVLLDPSNREHAVTIAEVKNESVRALNHRFKPAEPGAPPRFNVKVLEDVASGERSPPNFYLCWGLGNDLPKHGKKIYDGFKDMFFLKLADKDRPNILDRNGKPLVPGDKNFPYGGSVIAGTTTIYSYDNESRGANANLRTIVFMEGGAAFGGGRASAEEEYAALGDLGDAATPFDESAGVGSDPFSI